MKGNRNRVSKRRALKILEHKKQGLSRCQPNKPGVYRSGASLMLLVDLFPLPSPLLKHKKSKDKNIWHLLYLLL